MIRNTSREAAYRSLLNPLTLDEVARELSVEVTFIKEEIKAKRLKSNPKDKVTGNDLADYLISSRSGSELKKSKQN